MNKYITGIILSSILVPPFVPVSMGDESATAGDSMPSRTAGSVRTSILRYPESTSSEFPAVSTFFKLAQTGPTQNDEGIPQGYMKSISQEAAGTDATRLETSTSSSQPASEVAVPADAGKQDMGRINSIRSIVSEALAKPAPDSVESVEPQKVPTAPKQNWQLLREAVAGAPPPEDAPGDNYIPILKEEVATTVVIKSEKAGSSKTIATVSPATRAEGSTYLYTVRDGDSLWRIAERIYGSGYRWRSIYDANRDSIENPDALEKGEKLEIPKG